MPDLARAEAAAVLARIRDAGIPDDELTPVERAARAWRAEVLADLGDPAAVPAAKLALLDVAVVTKVLLDTLDAELLALAEAGGLVEDRGAVPLVGDRVKVADSLVRQLTALGLARRTRSAPSLSAYLAQRQAGGPANGGGAPAEATP